MQKSKPKNLKLKTEIEWRNTNDLFGEWEKEGTETKILNLI